MEVVVRDEGELVFLLGNIVCLETVTLKIYHIPDHADLLLEVVRLQKVGPEFVHDSVQLPRILELEKWLHDPEKPCKKSPALVYPRVGR